MKRIGRVVLYVCMIGISVTVAAQPSRWVNVKLQTRSAASGLEAQFQTLMKGLSEPAWVGYAVSSIPGNRTMCCFDSVSWSSDQGTSSCCGRCLLENGKGRNEGESNNSTSTVKLESAEQFFVLIRIQERKVEKVRMFSRGCELDGGGLPMYWLTDVRPAESIALLASLAMKAGEADDKTEASHLRNQAVAAIALHEDASADKALELAAAGRAQPESLRKQAVFWLGSARGEAGYQVLRRIVKEELSERVRDRAVFALSVSRAPGAVDTMIDVARQDPSAHVRGQALFWLAQKVGKKAVSSISEAIENDPDTGVKKRAVFALSQLPKDEGVPRLIEVAKSNRNPAVQKQAIFWLGQSKDPRALSFFEEVLTH